MAGYSKRPLAAKLGFRQGQRLCVLATPEGYAGLLGPLPEGLRLASTLRGRFDRIHFFARSERDLARRFPRLRDALEPDGMMWVSWPKKASGVATDLTASRVRRLALDGGMVDIKVCAVDDVWSALALVFRVADRPGIAAARALRERATGARR
jgi:hypothetical protein